jgi:hypothetical protein
MSDVQLPERNADEDSSMRNLLMLSAAASVIAIGMSAYHAAALSPGANSASPDGLVLKVQKSDEKGPGTRDGSAKGGDPGARGEDSGKRAGPGATQEKGSERGVAQDKGDRGAQGRSGEKGARGDGAKAQERSNVDVDVRGRRGDRDRADRRTRVDIDVDRDRRGYRADRRTRVDVDVDRRRRYGGRDVDVGVGYGYSSRGSCQDILRRYRQCMAR